MLTPTKAYPPPSPIPPSSSAKSWIKYVVIAVVIVIVVAGVIGIALSSNLGVHFNNPATTPSSSPTPSPSDYIGLEKIQFTNASSNLKPEGGYTIDLQIKNIGSVTTKFDNTTIFLNGQRIPAITGAIAIFSQTTLVTNASATGTITLPSPGFPSGMTVEVMIQTIPKGLQFSQDVILP